jgi:hypothetical protein
MRTAASLIAGLTLAASLAGCGGEDEPSCQEVVEKTCELCMKNFYELCVEEGQRDICGLDCDFPSSFKKCILNSVDCDAKEECYRRVQDTLRGEAVSTCEEFCQKCESCKQIFPEFAEGDCGTFTAEPDGECMSDCPGSVVEQLLSNLVVPISEFSCCELDFLF